MATLYDITCDTCPFGGKYSTKARADYAYRRHSCEKYLARAEARARGEERRAAVDRTPKPCTHKDAEHRHGTHTCYVLDRCKCGPCTAANSAYEADRVRQQAYGRWNGLVEAEPARRHVQSLMAQGMGLKRIVAVSNVTQGQLWKLLYGKPRPDGTRTPSRRIRPQTEAKILAVQLDLAPGARVDSTGAARRIQALVALGWSQSKIAARLGILRGNFTDLAQGRRGITVAHDQAVRALYDEWSMKLPPADNHRDKIAANRSRNYAKLRGWLPPLAWDDELLDDPAARPLAGARDEADLDEAAVLRRAAGDQTVTVTAAEAADVVRRLLAQGMTKVAIERLTGLNVHRVERQAS